MVTLDDASDKVVFTTWRPFDTKDALDRLIKIDSVVPFSIVSGSAATPWESRSEHGRINLYFSAIAVEDQPIPVPSTETTFADSRIQTYETHGWWCLVAWFPLGFALLAT